MEGNIAKSQHVVFGVMQGTAKTNSVLQDKTTQGLCCLLRSQELEVRSLNHPYSLKAKSSRCHYVLRNDTVSFWL